MISKRARMLANPVHFVLLLAGAACAQPVQDVLLQGNSGYSNDVVRAVNNYVNSGDRIALHGVSTSRPYYGVGASAEGGWKGVIGTANLAGSGDRYGVIGNASGGSTANYGVYGTASGTSAWAGYFSGNVRVTGSVTQGSDSKFKKNIRPMTGNLAKVMGLKPSAYEWKRAEYPQMGFTDSPQIGLIAQDVEKVVPEVVATSVIPSATKDAAVAETYKGVDYAKLVTVLIGAIQEQQAQIDELKKIRK